MLQDLGLNRLQLYARNALSRDNLKHLLQLLLSQIAWKRFQIISNAKFLGGRVLFICLAAIDPRGLLDSGVTLVKLFNTLGFQLKKSELRRSFAFIFKYFWISFSNLLFEVIANGISVMSNKVALGWWLILTTIKMVNVDGT